MNLNKSYDYFQPESVTETCRIIGCGSVGSTVAELLVRMGIQRFALYDFDRVEEHNIVNQMFFSHNVGQNKAEALAEILTDINPELEGCIEVHTEGWEEDAELDGYVFLCVDDIDLRRQICEENAYNPLIKASFDFRTRLEDAVHYATEWNIKGAKSFIKTMNYSHEEAREATPVSACGIVLGVAPTVRAVCTAGVCNFINYVKGKGLKKVVFVNPFEMRTDEL